MAREREKTTKPGKTPDVSDETFNQNLTAIPQAQERDEGMNDEVGKMNVTDAKASGYIDEKGKAVSKAKEDIPGIPTGAYTDIGAGRSSAVRHKH